MKRFKETSKDVYSILDNETKETKVIGNKNEFIEYVEFYSKKKFKNIWQALDYFDDNMGGGEVGVGLEIVVHYG